MSGFSLDIEIKYIFLDIEVSWSNFSQGFPAVLFSPDEPASPFPPFLAFRRHEQSAELQSISASATCCDRSERSKNNMSEARVEVLTGRGRCRDLQSPLSRLCVRGCHERAIYRERGQKKCTNDAVSISRGRSDRSGDLGGCAELAHGVYKFDHLTGNLISIWVLVTHRQHVGPSCFASPR